jgi:hypothetical protein
VRGGERPRLTPLGSVSGSRADRSSSGSSRVVHRRVLLALRPGRRRARCAVWWFGSAQDSNLRPSDYPKPLPDNAGHDGTPLLTSADTSQYYVLVPGVGGCFG